MNIEITKLNAAQQQAIEEEKLAADKCTRLAKDIDDLMDEVISVVSHNIDIYGTCDKNKVRF